MGALILEIQDILLCVGFQLCVRVGPLAHCTHTQALIDFARVPAERRLFACAAETVSDLFQTPCRPPQKTVSRRVFCTKPEGGGVGFCAAGRDAEAHGLVLERLRRLRVCQSQSPELLMERDAAGRFPISSANLAFPGKVDVTVMDLESPATRVASSLASAPPPAWALPSATSTVACEALERFWRVRGYKKRKGLRFCAPFLKLSCSATTLGLSRPAMAGEPGQRQPVTK